MAGLVPVETSIAWRWRCSTEGKVVSGAELGVCIEGAEGVRLADYRALKVDPARLRCSCGGHVFPVAPFHKHAQGTISIFIRPTSRRLPQSSS